MTEEGNHTHLTEKSPIHFMYDISYKTIHYTNDKEYREWIRKLFHMKINEEKIQSWRENEIDEISIDEMIYDEESISLGIDYIYSKTKQLKLFQTLFQKAAAKMISTNMEIGIVILFSYDYFSLFHECIVEYFSSPNTFTIHSPCYQTLLESL
jgi:hypothetical protein